MTRRHVISELSRSSSSLPEHKHITLSSTSLRFIIAMVGRRPLSTRPLDLIYFCFFLVHIPASFLVDFQALYPPSFVPAVLQRFLQFYIETSGDPLISGALRIDHTYVWFRSLIWLEILFQVPVFILGARGLWKDSPSIYLLLLLYGASTSTTLLPCLATILAVPMAKNDAGAFTMPAITAAQRFILLFSYVPFLLVPFAMTMDMAWRISSLLDFRRHPHTDVAGRMKREH